MKRNMSLSVGTIVAFFVLGLLIALQLKNINIMNLQAFYSEKDIAGLKDEVMSIMLENSDLSDQNKKLSDLISSMGDQLAGDDKSLQAIIQEKKNAEIFAGLTDVSGNGIQIIMDSGTDIPVKSSSLLLIINELRSSGALAICINDERIVAMSEIRDTGTSEPQVVINGNSYPATSQFVIKAIFNAKDIHRGIQLVNDIVSQLNTLGTITVSSSDSLSIPKLSEDAAGNS